MKKVRTFLLFTAALPALWIAGFIVANAALEPHFEQVDLSDPPVDLAVLAAWDDDDGQPRCRAFYRLDLLRHSDSAPELRFRLSDSDMATCRASIDAFRREGAWPDRFPWERRALGAAAARPDPSDPDLFEVAYPPDEDRIAVTRYEVDTLSGEPSTFEFRGSFGPARGVGALFFGGAGGSVIWLTLVAGYVVRSAAGHRGGAAKGEQLD